MVLDLVGSNHQKRTGKTYSLFKHYYPLNIDAVSIESHAQTYGRIGIAASAENVPIKDDSIDCIITNAFLEHPEYPETILNEFVRILKPGGIVVHNDAWFCRLWQRFGLIGLKSFSK
ncbi:class I SAM-dependent methyltransferase [Salibacteraceae bacterium]|nr:class I SAM-dependent methyltransferase [Salibacteraceae bacterium]